MAESTVAEQITKLETQIATLDALIEKHQGVSELEENGDFRTKFTDVSKLYDRRDILNDRLQYLNRHCK